MKFVNWTRDCLIKLFAIVAVGLLFLSNDSASLASEDDAGQTIAEMAEAFDAAGYVIDEQFDGGLKKNKRQRFALPGLEEDTVYTVVFATGSPDARIVFTITGPGSFKVVHGAGERPLNFSFQVPRSGKYRLTVTMRVCESELCAWKGFLAHPM